ncbi:8467_t:CDS:2, partial [Acaulospora morrowiae]
KEKCNKIRFEVFVKEQNCSAENEIDKYDSSSTCHYFLAIKSSLPVGTVRIHLCDSLNSNPPDHSPEPLSPTKVTKIGRLAVLKPFRNLGIGTLLLQSAESFAMSNLGILNFILHAQLNKKEWYEKRGYRVLSDRVFIEEGIEHLKLGKTIKI